ncbi:hypothetical protein OZX72_02515 [Bifidobacterium sp. ESL0769]|uniref:hypothetical protein n=1 Tax=unclassified Bifidobacterium TaxID=2608897 RepID=UPI0023F79F91|nr:MULTISPECIES: hypothetical protein [unclassified Bifidobacterium]WEV47216.1 hypothetical protein OZX62_02725 [Bifidobacterium sp. ESL0690]WEV67881.1 hypothetical protein OZX72_02515 [Bifidobacterium sp. ESL0769]
MGYYSGNSVAHSKPSGDEEEDLKRAERLRQITSEQEDLENLRWHENACDEQFVEEFSTLAGRTRQIYEDAGAALSQRKQEQLAIIEDVERNVRESAEQHSDEVNRYCLDASMRLDEEADGLRKKRRDSRW